MFFGLFWDFWGKLCHSSHTLWQKCFYFRIQYFKVYNNENRAIVAKSLGMVGNLHFFTCTLQNGRFGGFWGHFHLQYIENMTICGKCDLRGGKSSTLPLTSGECVMATCTSSLFNLVFLPGCPKKRQKCTFSPFTLLDDHSMTMFCQ